MVPGTSFEQWGEGVSFGVSQEIPVTYEPFVSKAIETRLCKLQRVTKSIDSGSRTNVSRFLSALSLLFLVLVGEQNKQIMTEEQQELSFIIGSYNSASTKTEGSRKTKQSCS